MSRLRTVSGAPLTRPTGGKFRIEVRPSRIMKRILFECILLAAIAVLLVACHKQNAVSEMEKAADAMAKAETAQPPSTPAPQPSDQAAHVLVPPGAPAVPPPAQQVQEALAAYKAGNLEDAVTRLQKLRATRVLSPQQRMALQDSIAAVMTEIYTMAEKGDTRAIAAVMQYEKMQTAPR